MRTPLLIKRNLRASAVARIALPLIAWLVLGLSSMDATSQQVQREEKEDLLQSILAGSPAEGGPALAALNAEGVHPVDKVARLESLAASGNAAARIILIELYSGRCHFTQYIKSICGIVEFDPDKRDQLRKALADEEGEVPYPSFRLRGQEFTAWTYFGRAQRAGRLDPGSEDCRAAVHYMELADANGSRCIGQLAERMYYSGLCVAKDRVKWLEWAKKSASCPKV
jgi:hypothetical protein